MTEQDLVIALDKLEAGTDKLAWLNLDKDIKIEPKPQRELNGCRDWYDGSELDENWLMTG